MPELRYECHSAAGNQQACAILNPILGAINQPVIVNLTWPQLFNAQLRLGVYPQGWVLREMRWRIYSLAVTAAPWNDIQAALAAGQPALGIAPGNPVLGNAANLAPSPVALGVDATERGQLGYHLGTACGGALAEYLVPAQAQGIQWFPFHLSRAQANGGIFHFAGNQRPDIVIFEFDPQNLQLHRFVVWENKGHAGRAAGGRAALLPALGQAQTLVSMTTLPGIPNIQPQAAVLQAQRFPDAHIASMADVYHNNFRVQTIDPPNPKHPPVVLNPRSGDAFLDGYYRPFAETVRNGQQRSYDGRSFQTVDLPERVRLGLDSDIYRALREKGGPGALSARIGRSLARGYTMKFRRTIYIHSTGISIELPTFWAPDSDK